VRSRKEAARIGKPKKPAPYELAQKCVTCGKMLPAGVRYCVSRGTHDQAEFDSRVADLDVELERRPTAPLQNEIPRRSPIFFPP